MAKLSGKDLSIDTTTVMLKELGNPFWIYSSQHLTTGESGPLFCMCSTAKKIIFQQNQDELLLVCFDEEANSLLVGLCTAHLWTTQFELCGFLYMRGFSTDLSSSNPCCSRVNSKVGNRVCRGPTVVILKFFTMQRSVPLTHALFKGRLYYQEGFNEKVKPLPKGKGSRVITNHWKPKKTNDLEEHIWPCHVQDKCAVLLDQHVIRLLSLIWVLFLLLETLNEEKTRN